MKYLITERQYGFLIEQSSYEKGIWDRSSKMLDKMTNLDPHVLAEILGIVTLFVPIVGPVISTSIGLLDAALYYKEGDKKTAAMYAMFPFLPLGKLGKLIPSMKELGKEGMQSLAKKLGMNGGKGLSNIEKQVVHEMMKNKEVLKQDLKSISNDLVNKSQSSGAKILNSFEKRFLLNTCFAHNNCPAFRSILSDFYAKLGNTAKLTKFFPSEVKVLSKSVVAGREVIEVQLKDGTKLLFYKSSGSNVGTTGKMAGEWFVIPGFAQNGWFFKTEETIELTKGGNKYLTDMAEFLQMNGSGMLGR